MKLVEAEMSERPAEEEREGGPNLVKATPPDSAAVTVTLLPNYDISNPVKVKVDFRKLLRIMS